MLNLVVENLTMEISLQLVIVVEKQNNNVFNRKKEILILGKQKKIKPFILFFEPLFFVKKKNVGHGALGETFSR